MSLDSIIDVSVSTKTTTPSRKSFGLPMLAAYFPTSVFPGRSRLYTSLDDMVSDGHLVTDATYLMATALKANNPSVKSWKIGRKANASVQTLRVTPTIYTAGEVLRLTVEGTDIARTIPASSSINAEATALAALLAAIPGVTAADGTGYVTLTPKNVLSNKITVTTADNSKNFIVTINGTAFTYASDTSATKTEIQEGLIALINAGAWGTIATASSTDAMTIAAPTHAGLDIRVSATGAGVLTISLEVSAAQLLSVGGVSAGLTVKNNTPDPGLLADLQAIEAEDSDFYGLGIDSESEAEIKIAAAHAETLRTLFIPSTIDTETKTSATTDVAAALFATGYRRTGGIQAEYNSQYSGLRWLGRQLALDPGSSDYAFKQLPGVTVSAFSGSEMGYLDAKNWNHYTTEGGVKITRWGKASSGEWFDVVHGADWFQARLQERIYGIRVNIEKLPFEIAGELFLAQLRAQLEEGVKKNVIAPNTADTPWVITVPALADISSVDKAARNFPAITFSAYLAGSVNTLQIQGTLSA